MRVASNQHADMPQCNPDGGGVSSAKLRGEYFMPKITGVCVGESLVGEGNEVAHVDLLLGPRGSAVETAYCIGLTNNKDGFTTLRPVRPIHCIQ